MQQLSLKEVGQVSGGEVGAVGSDSNLLYTGSVMTPYEACLVNGIGGGGFMRMIICAINPNL
jgi:hypothetical protein